MRKIIRSAFCIIGLLGAPAVYSFQLGGFDVKPVAKIMQVYDDNISSVEDNRLSDWSTLFTLGLDGLYDAKTESLSVKAIVNHEMFYSERDFDHTSENLAIRYKKEFSEYDRLTLGNSFTHADQPPAFEDEFGRSAGRYDYYKNSFDIGYDHDFTEKFTLKLKYANHYYDPSNSISNSLLNKPGLQADYSFGPNTTGSLYYDYTNYHFDPGGTAAKHATALGVKRYLTKQVYFDLRSGIDVIDPISGDGTARPFYFAGLFNELDETTYAGISVTKAYDINYYSSDIFDNWRVVLYGGRQVTDHLTLIGSLFTGGGSFAQSGIKEKFNGASTGFDYDISKNLTANLRYSLSIRESSSAGDDYRKNTVSLGMTIKF